MTSMEFLELLGSVRDTYVVEAREEATPARRLSGKRVLLIAAVIALSLLLVGCGVAYVSGWFTDFFATRSGEPLSSEQIGFIQENEQIIQQTQSKGGWTMELKSAICAGDTAYVIFGVTAPEDVDLEGANIDTPLDQDSIIPGNAPSMSISPDQRRDILHPSVDTRELNFYYGGQNGWEADNDGRANTLNYVFRITVETLDPGKEIGLEEPFGSDISFDFRFDNFIHTWEDAEKRAEIDAKYAGQDYIIDGEELDGLYKYELLTEETWEFTVTFDGAALEDTSIELITEPVMTWANVSWRLQADNPMGYDIGDGISAVKITSFILNPFGATLTYEFSEEAAFSAFIEYQQNNGYTDRYVYAVMKDGSKVALHTDGSGDKLTAETPIVLSEVDHILLGDLDHILLGDGVTIPMP